MRHLFRLLSLPPSLLLLLATLPPAIIAEPQWPHNLPAHAKYFPQDEPLVRRGLSAQEQLASQSPVGVRKMSEDDNEMFFLDYWQFEEAEHDVHSPSRRDKKLWTRSIPADLTNNTLGELLPPLLLHSNGLDQSAFGLSPRALFARDFQCPTGTNNCSSINHPYSCCATGETCVSVADNGIGNVGCCPQGVKCTRDVAACDTSAGYKSCPGSSNGGCCIPNFDCDGIGCVSQVGTSTVTTTLPIVTVTTCASNWHTCAASLGGGCCQNGATCGSSTFCITSGQSTSISTTTTTSPSSSPTITTSLVAPIRPTGSSDSGDATVPSTLTTGTSLIAVCPSSFYFCSAYYRPGCCRIGRDCATTNCPAAASSSTLVSNGVTILVPVGGSTGGSTYVTTALITGTAPAASSFRSGSCAGGWSSCDASVGGGCCPPAFGCGTICSATGPGATGVVSKIAPSRASSHQAEIIGFLWLGFGAFLGMAMLIL